MMHKNILKTIVGASVVTVLALGSVPPAAAQSNQRLWYESETMPAQKKLLDALKSDGLLTQPPQPSLTYPGSEYSAFGARQWQIFQRGDVEEIERTRRNLGTINGITAPFNKGEQDRNRDRQDHLEQLYRDEILRELGRKTR